MKKLTRAASLLTAFMLLAGTAPVYGAQADTQMPKEEARRILTNRELPSDIRAYDRPEDVPEQDHYSLRIQCEKNVLTPGETTALSVSTDAPVDELTYESSDPAVAKVSAKGVVTAVSGQAAGSARAVITVRYRDKVSATCEITVRNVLTVSKDRLTLYAGGSERITAQSLPAGNITWQSSNSSVASVNAAGNITAKKAGNATITAVANGLSARCEVTVKKATLKLKSRATVYIRNPQSLGATALPARRIKWSSSDKKIATVTTKGVVTGKKQGKVTITAKANGVTKKCRVTVKAPSVSFYNTNAAVFKDSSVKLSALASPAAAVKWKSSNSKVARVDKNGVVTGRKTGKAKITAYVNGAKATCTVRVLKNPYSLNFEKRTLMVEDSGSLYVKGLGDEGEPTFHLEDSDGCVSLKSDGNECTITALHKGQATIRASFSTYVEGNLVSWSEVSKVEVVDTGISRQEFSIAKNETQQLGLVNVGEETIQSVAWSSSNPTVASIDTASGLLKGENAGTSQITAEAVYQDGRTVSYTTEMKVSDPKMKSAQLTVALKGKRRVQLKGTNTYSIIKWRSKKSSVVAVNADRTVVPRKKGKDRKSVV